VIRTYIVVQRRAFSDGDLDVIRRRDT